MSDIVKSKEPQERKFSLALSLYFIDLNNSLRKYGKRGKCPFFFLLKGAMSNYLSLVREHDLLMVGYFLE